MIHDNEVRVLEERRNKLLRMAEEGKGVENVERAMAIELELNRLKEERKRFHELMTIAARNVEKQRRRNQQ